MGIRILVADDDAGYRFPIKNLFEDYAYEVLEATNRQDVVNMGVGADVWIIDVRLPTGEMEGILAVRDLVEQGIQPPHPVIFISVNPESLAEEKLAALKGKVRYEWVEKPFELEFLLAKVEGFLKGATQ